MTALSQFIETCKEKGLAYELIENDGRLLVSNDVDDIFTWKLKEVNGVALIDQMEYYNVSFVKQVFPVWGKYLKTFCLESGYNGIWINDDMCITSSEMGTKIIRLEEGGDWFDKAQLKKWVYLPANQKGVEEAHAAFSTTSIMRDVLQTFQAEEEHVHALKPLLEGTEVLFRMVIRGTKESCAFIVGDQTLRLGNGKTPRYEVYETSEEAASIIVGWIRDIIQSRRLRELISVPRLNFDKMGSRYRCFSTHQETIYAHLKNRFHFADIELNSLLDIVYAEIVHICCLRSEENRDYELVRFMGTYLLIDMKTEMLCYIGEDRKELEKVAHGVGLSKKDLDETIQSFLEDEIFEKGSLLSS